MSYWKMSFIIAWNITRLLVRPKNMTRGSNRPQFIGEIFCHGLGHLVEDIRDQR